MKFEVGLNKEIFLLKTNQNIKKYETFIKDKGCDMAVNAETCPHR